MRKEVMNLRESKEGYMGGFGGRKGMRKMMKVYYNLKIK